MSWIVEPDHTWSSWQTEGWVIMKPNPQMSDDYLINIWITDTHEDGIVYRKADYRANKTLVDMLEISESHYLELLEQGDEILMEEML